MILEKVQFRTSSWTITISKNVLNQVLSGLKYSRYTKYFYSICTILFTVEYCKIVHRHFSSVNRMLDDSRYIFSGFQIIRGILKTTSKPFTEFKNGDNSLYYLCHNLTQLRQSFFSILSYF